MAAVAGQQGQRDCGRGVAGRPPRGPGQSLGREAPGPGGLVLAEPPEAPPPADAPLPGGPPPGAGPGARGGPGRGPGGRGGLGPAPGGRGPTPGGGGPAPPAPAAPADPRRDATSVASQSCITPPESSSRTRSAGPGP